MLGIEFQRAEIALDGHIDGVVIRHLRIVEFDVNARDVVPGDGIVRGNFDEPFVALGFQELFLSAWTRLD
jgi:hypothetical protein